MNVKLTPQDALVVMQQGWPEKTFVFQKEDNRAFYFKTPEDEVKIIKDDENEGYFSVEGRLIGHDEWDDWDVFSKEEVQAYIQNANRVKFNVAQNQHRYINTLPSDVQALVEGQVHQHLIALGYRQEELAVHVENAMASRLSDLEEVVDYEELQEAINTQANELASAKHIKGLPKNKNWEVDFS